MCGCIVLENERLTPVKVIALNTHTNEVESIVLRSEIEKRLDVTETVSDRDIDMVSMMLYIKDTTSLVMHIMRWHPFVEHPFVERYQGTII